MDTSASDRREIAILGAGNIGQALAAGWASAGIRDAAEIVLTRRDAGRLEELADQGFRTTPDNRAAVHAAPVVVLAVQPQQLAPLLEEIGPALDPDRHLVISVVSDVTIGAIRARLGTPVQVVRAMPNTAIAIGESMTCLSAGDRAGAALDEARELFDAVGETLEIREELMVSATALGACGIAFFLRAVRAASQGGIEIGFHPDEALRLAAQTARGAASLLRAEGSHPESELDKVTTPRGCTIAGLNEMEHHGFSSALIKGIVVSAEKADELYEES